MVSFKLNEELRRRYAPETLPKARENYRRIQENFSGANILNALDDLHSQPLKYLKLAQGRSIGVCIQLLFKRMDKLHEAEEEAEKPKPSFFSKLYTKMKEIYFDMEKEIGKTNAKIAMVMFCLGGFSPIPGSSFAMLGLYRLAVKLIIGFNKKSTEVKEGKMLSVYTSEFAILG